MDEFGVLVEKIGFKAHGNSAPMAKLKPKPNSHFTTNNTSSFVDSSLPVDELDRIFRSSVTVNKTKKSENLFNHDDIFGGSSNQFGGIDFESVLNNSNVNNWKNRSKLDSLGSSGFDDLLGLDSKQGDPINDDVFGSFKVNTSGKQEEQGSGFVDLIPGFEGYSHPNKERQLKKNFFPESNSQPFHPKQTVEDDPFLVFESSASPSDASSIFDNLDDFASGRIHEDSRSDRTMNKTNKPTADPFSNGFENVDYLDAMFMGSAPKSRPTSTTQDSQFDIFFPQEKGPAVKPTSLSPPLSTNKVSFFGSTGNDLTSLFGDVGPSSGAFQEIEGESKERRMARLNRHVRMNTRVAEALAEKNQRDLQSQYEQEEKNRLSGTLDDDIKRWAAGKEGNLRALLSSLQQVLWPECGWRQVSLTDLITSDSVKKVYKRAALCVHPDKVQQKGANLQQKYIAEKVFDLLKEASNKFSAEELR